MVKKCTRKAQHQRHLTAQSPIQQHRAGTWQRETTFTVKVRALKTPGWSTPFSGGKSQPVGRGKRHRLRSFLLFWGWEPSKKKHLVPKMRVYASNFLSAIKQKQCDVFHFILVKENVESTVQVNALQSSENLGNPYKDTGGCRLKEL